MRSGSNTTNLERYCRLLTGLKLDKEVPCLVFFSLGSTRAVFQSDGKCPKESEEFTTLVMMGRSISDMPTTKLVGIGSS